MKEQLLQERAQRKQQMEEQRAKAEAAQREGAHTEGGCSNDGTSGESRGLSGMMQELQARARLFAELIEQETDESDQQAWSGMVEQLESRVQALTECIEQESSESEGEESRRQEAMEVDGSEREGESEMQQAGVSEGRGQFGSPDRMRPQQVRVCGGSGFDPDSRPNCIHTHSAVGCMLLLCAVDCSHKLKCCNNSDCLSPCSCVHCSPLCEHPHKQRPAPERQQSSSKSIKRISILSQRWRCRPKRALLLSATCGCSTLHERTSGHKTSASAT